MSAVLPARLRPALHLLRHPRASRRPSVRRGGVRGERPARRLWHVPVLHGVSLALEAGEALGIVGHNGMGKTTLLKALMGLLPVSSGRVSVDGVDVTREPAHARNRLGIAYVPQGRGILPALSALDNLRLAWNHDTEETEQEALDRVLALFPRLTHLLDRRGRCSCRAASSSCWRWLARSCRARGCCCSTSPRRGSSPPSSQEIGQILAHLRADAGLTMIVVEQNLDLVLDVTTRIAVLEKGRIAQDAADPRTGRRRSSRTCWGWALRAQRAGPATADRTPPRTERAPPTQHPPLLRAAPRGGLRRAHTAPRNRWQLRRHQRTHSTDTTMATVKRPTLDQMKDIVASLHMSMSEREIHEYMEVMEGTLQAYDRLTQLPDNLPPVRYPRTPGYRPGAAENPLNAWAVKSEVRGAPYGPLSGKRIVLKDNVCLGRRADDERRLDARGLRARRRRHGRHPHSRCRRHHRGQGALRVLLPVRRQPHLGDGAGAQPLQVRLLRGRIVVRLGGAGGLGRGRHGHRRRPGRLDPHARRAGPAATA